jgi:lysozyme
MKISADGLATLEAREGKRKTMYLDSGSAPTVGCGHLLTLSERRSGKLWLFSGKVDWDRGLTDEQVDELLRKDLAVVENTLHWALLGLPELTQPQYDALVSFTFNVGGAAFQDSTLLKRIRAGRLGDVPAEMQRWVYDAGRRVPALEVRRAREVEQWLTEV